ncbi:hypothetical protein IWQ56_007506, partial [Coemansia nantahalensis]
RAAAKGAVPARDRGQHRTAAVSRRRRAGAVHGRAAGGHRAAQPAHRCGQRAAVDGALRHKVQGAARAAAGDRQWRGAAGSVVAGRVLGHAAAGRDPRAADQGAHPLARRRVRAGTQCPQGARHPAVRSQGPPAHRRRRRCCPARRGQGHVAGAAGARDDQGPPANVPACAVAGSRAQPAPAAGCCCFCFCCAQQAPVPGGVARPVAAVQPVAAVLLVGVGVVVLAAALGVLAAL